MNNDKFIGEMTFSEFKEAIRYILSSEGDLIDEDEDKPKKNFKQYVEDIIKLKFITDFINKIKTQDNFRGLKKIWSNIKYVITFEFFKDFIKWWKTPLTKEVYIKRGKIVKKWIYDLVETVVFVLVMVILIRFFIGEIRWIPSGSMHPTLLEGDRIFVERSSRFYTTPKRGDIMVFYPPSTHLSNMPLPLLSRLTGIFCKDIAYIKRVVGLPGEKIEIKFEKDGSAYVFINDNKFEEGYIQSPYEYPLCPIEQTKEVLNDKRIMKCGPFYLKNDEYFMMGDNRGNSQDSRYWGPLKQDRFIGRAVNIFWPVHRKRNLSQIK